VSGKASLTTASLTMKRQSGQDDHDQDDHDQDDHDQDDQDKKPKAKVGKLDLKNPKFSEKTRKLRQKCHKLYETKQPGQPTLHWVPYRDRLISKVEFQEQAKKFLLDIKIPSVNGPCTNTRVVLLCKFCQAVLLEAKIIKTARLEREKMLHQNDIINRRKWNDLDKKNKKGSTIGAPKTFRLSPPSFQHKPGCSLYKFSVHQQKIEGVHVFSVSEDLYHNDDLLKLAQEYLDEGPFQNSTDKIEPMEGKGAKDNHRYFTSIFVQDQFKFDAGIRERESQVHNRFVISLYKDYCQEHGRSIVGLDEDVELTESLQEKMDSDFEDVVKSMNLKENAWGLVSKNTFVKVIDRAKNQANNSKKSRKTLIQEVFQNETIPQKAPKFIDMCRYASMRRRMSGIVLPFEDWTPMELNTQLVHPEDGVKADSERVSLIRFLYPRIDSAPVKFAAIYSRIMFSIHKFLCYDCGLEDNILGPKRCARNTLEREPKTADSQMSVAGFLKGGKSEQTAHRDVAGMSAQNPKPKSGSIIAVLKGTRRIKIRDTIYELIPGQAIWFDGDVKHNGMDNTDGSLALHIHVDDNNFYRVAYDLDVVGSVN
jgi:hypothetical protein